MSERDRRIWEHIPDESTADPREERLRVLCAAAYDPVKPSEALRRKVAEVTQLQDTRALCPAGRWWVPGLRWAPAAGILTAALLVAVGLVCIRSNDHRSNVRQTPLIVVRRPPDRPPHAPHPLSRHPRRNLRPQVAQSQKMLPRTRREDAWPSRLSSAFHPEAPVAGDLDPLSRGPEAAPPHWLPVRPEERDEIEEQVRRAVPVRDDFVRIPFPQIVSTSDHQIAAAVESYKREAAIVDPRLAHEVTLQQKATALSDLCESLRSDTGIHLTAGTSVADEKVTLFCKRMPLREVMRQLSRPFGYAWLRSSRDGAYRYELTQDLRSQLLEEELRNRDRNAALVALDKELERYRPYLSLSPDEALARAKTALPVEKKLLEKLAGPGWGVIQMYFRLSAQQSAAMRAGQSVSFSSQPEPAEHSLPPDVAQGMLQGFRDRRLKKASFDIGFDFTVDLTDPAALPLTLQTVRTGVELSISQGELGQFRLHGVASLMVAGKPADGVIPGTSIPDDYAVGVSPVVEKPDNGARNVKLAHELALRPRVTLQPQPSCGGTGGSSRDGRSLPPAASEPPDEKKVSMADVLEAVHRATGLPIVSDFYTRLYKPEAITVRNQPLFDALNQVADTMRLRWNRDGEWLQFRSTSFYDDRLKEVPNRLLARWAAARRQRTMLSLDELLEIAQLPDAQLEGAEMAEGARRCFGLEEWNLARDGVLRPHLRYMASFTPEQRRLAMSTGGLAFTRMSLAQQQQFLAYGVFGAQPLRSLEDLAGAVLRVEYTQPGEFRWEPAGMGTWLRWAVPLEPGPQGHRVLVPPIRGRTQEETVQAARRIEPQLREGLSKGFSVPAERVDQEILEGRIVPTELDLKIAYIPGSSNRLLIRQVSFNNNHWFASY